MEEFLLPCLNKEIFGLDCYGCGGQRAMLLLVKGEFGAALKLFPPIYPVLFLLGFVIFNLFYKFKNDYIIKIGLVILTAAILVGNYIFKMFQLIN